jgi:hypothetical protein
VTIPLELSEGSTENAAVATEVLADLVDRGLNVGQGVLCVLDDAKALRKAVRDVLGADTPVAALLRHKECHEECRPRLGPASRGVGRLRGETSCSSLLGSVGR